MSRTKISVHKSVQYCIGIQKRIQQNNKSTLPRTICINHRYIKCFPGIGVYHPRVFLIDHWYMACFPRTG